MNIGFARNVSTENSPDSLVCSKALGYNSAMRRGSITSCLSIGLTLVFAGCASKDFAEPKEIGGAAKVVRKTFSSSYTDVWNGALRVLDERNFPLAESRKDKGYIVTDWIPGKSDRLFSGYGESKIPYTIRYKLILDIQPTKSGTRVSLTNKEQYYTDAVSGGFDFQGSLYQWLDTASSGEKEALILDDLSLLLGAKK